MRRPLVRACIHMVDVRGRPLLHEHKTCGKLFDPVMVCAECGEQVLATQVHVHLGPGVGKPHNAAAETVTDAKVAKVKSRGKVGHASGAA